MKKIIACIVLAFLLFLYVKIAHSEIILLTEQEHKKRQVALGLLSDQGMYAMATYMLRQIGINALSARNYLTTDQLYEKLRSFKFKPEPVDRISLTLKSEGDCEDWTIWALVHIWICPAFHNDYLGFMLAIPNDIHKKGAQGHIAPFTWLAGEKEPTIIEHVGNNQDPIPFGLSDYLQRFKETIGVGFRYRLWFVRLPSSQQWPIIKY